MACAIFFAKRYVNAFCNRVISQFQVNVGIIGVLSGEHTVYVVVAGLDKANIPVHYYLAMSTPPAIPQTDDFE